MPSNNKPVKGGISWKLSVFSLLAWGIGSDQQYSTFNKAYSFSEDQAKRKYKFLKLQAARTLFSELKLPFYITKQHVNGMLMTPAGDQWQKNYGHEGRYLHWQEVLLWHVEFSSSMNSKFMWLNNAIKKTCPDVTWSPAKRGAGNNSAADTDFVSRDSLAIFKQFFIYCFIENLAISMCYPA